MPIGLSFFTLKKIAYIIDISRGQIIPTTNFFEYACFVAFFPQIIAGSIALKILSPSYNPDENGKGIFSLMPGH